MSKKFLPKRQNKSSWNSQGGALPILILLAAVGILLFLLISNTASFRDNLFNMFFPKPSSRAAQEATSVPDEVLFKFKPGASEEAKSNIKNEHALEVLETIPSIDVLRVRVPAQARDRVIEALSNNPNIEYAEPNFIAENLTNDTYYANQWNLPKVSAPDAWAISQGNSSVAVAVIDGGITDTFSEFQGKVLPGWNFVDNNNNISEPANCAGHGTMVSSIIGALTNNSKGVASLGWNTSVMPLRTTYLAGYDTNNKPLCLNTYSAMTSAIIYAADNGAKVINISIGGTADSSTMQSAIDYAWSRGLVIVAASGNSGPCTNCIFYPARGNNVIAAGGTDSNDNLSTFSNTGSQQDVVAPATGVYGMWATSYGYGNGTSFASPHVAALAALIFAANSSLTNQDVLSIIVNSVDDKGTPGFDNDYGWGRINAYKALLLATGQPIPSTSPTPFPTPIPTSTPTTNSVIISNVSSTTMANSATIKWSTNISSTSKVTYGISSTNLSFSTTEDTNLTTNHTVTITGLNKQTRYYFKVYSKNSVGLESSSTVQQFRTKNR